MQQYELETLLVRIKADFSEATDAAFTTGLNNLASSISSNAALKAALELKPSLSLKEKFDGDIAIVKAELASLNAAAIITPTINLSRLNTVGVKEAVAGSFKKSSVVPEDIEYAIKQIRDFHSELAGIGGAANYLRPLKDGLSEVVAVVSKVQASDAIGFVNFARQVREANDTLGPVKGTPAVIRFSDMVKQAFENTKAITDLPSLQTFAVQVKNTNNLLSQLVPASPELVPFVQAMNQAASMFISIKEAAGFRAFATGLRTANREMANLQPVSPELTPFVEAMSSAAARFTSIREARAFERFATGVKSANVTVQGIQAAPPGFDQFIQQMNNAAGVFTNIKGASGIGTFARNIERANTTLKNAGGMPQLKDLAANATGAASALSLLNKELALYNSLIGRRSINIPPNIFTSAASTAGAGGSRGRSSAASAFGFDPVRRSLSMVTGMATGMAVGFLGFHMIREVTQFDDEMTRAMALLTVHLRDERLALGEEQARVVESMANVRATVERDILDLSTGSVHSPRELAAAFRELTAAGYGTANAMQALAVVSRFALVNTMDVAKAAQDLAKIQRQLGQESDNAAENTAKMRHIADVITSGAVLSGTSPDHFLQGIIRLTPHLQFLNSGLEDTVGLLAAMSRSGDTSNALRRTEELVRGMSDLFIASNQTIGTTRTGAPSRHDIRGQQTFRTGQGVQPVHEMIDSVRQAKQTWDNMGIHVFEGGQFMGVAHAIGAIDRAFRDLNPEQRATQIRLLFAGGRQGAAEAAIALLNNRAALEQFLLSARNADGIMDSMANVVMLSFNNQLKILSNNFTVVGIQVGNALVPALVVVNSLLLEAFGLWKQLGAAGQNAVVTLVLIGLGLAVLRLAIPYVTGLLKVLFWDTMIAGASMAAAPFRALWFVISIGATAAYYSLVGVLYILGALLNPIMLLNTATVALDAVITAKRATTTAWLGGLLLVRAAIYAWTAAMGTFRTAMVLSTASTFANMIVLSVFKAVYLTAQAIIWGGVVALTAAMGGQAGSVVSTTASYAAYIIALIASTAFSVVLKVATWALSVAFAVLAVTLTVILTITGLIIISFGLLVGVMVVIAAAFMAVAWVVKSLVVLLAEFLGQLNGNNVRDFAGAWDGFVEGGKRAFWNLVGFMDNFRHNMRVIMNWLQANWDDLIFNMGHMAEMVFENTWENVKIGFAKMIVGMMQLWLNMAGAMGRALVAVLAAPAAPNPVAAIQAAGEAFQAVFAAGTDIGNLSRREFVSLTRETEPVRRAMSIADVGAGGEAVRETRNRLIQEDINRTLELVRQNGNQAELQRLQEVAQRNPLSMIRPIDMEGINQQALAAGNAAVQAAREAAGGLRELRNINQGSGLFSRGTGIRWDVSESTRELIEGMFNRPALNEANNNAIDAANKVGTIFKEVSLNRFVLDTTTENQESEQIRLMRDQNELLRQIRDGRTTSPNYAPNEQVVAGG